MIALLLSILLAIHGSVGGRVVQHIDSAPIITTDGEVLAGISLPPYGKLCQETPVRGGPDAAIYEPLYSLPTGSVVQLREQPRFDPRDWAMIAPAQWIPLSALCE
jgi:hypothetical protein